MISNRRRVGDNSGGRFRNVLGARLPSKPWFFALVSHPLKLSRKKYSGSNYCALSRADNLLSIRDRVERTTTREQTPGKPLIGCRLNRKYNFSPRVRWSLSSKFLVVYARLPNTNAYNKSSSDSQAVLTDGRWPRLGNR